jgi:hypothetical protein
MSTAEPRKWENEAIVFKTKDHPEANGRKPKFGEAEYQCTFPIEDGRFVTIRMGQAGFDNTTNLLMDMLSNAPNHDDGSTPPKLP